MRAISLTMFVFCAVGCISVQQVEEEPTDTQLQAATASGGWSTFPTLCWDSSWCVTSGNLVKMWQSILWADGNFANASSIDGGFGSMTRGATINWQNTWLPSDGGSGNVGPHTWTAAENGRLDLDVNGDICQGGVYRFIYLGSSGRNFRLTENCTTFAWRFVNPRTGAWTDATY